MIPRDPNCDNDDCDYDIGGWEHVEECPAGSGRVPRGGSFPVYESAETYFARYRQSTDKLTNGN